MDKRFFTAAVIAAVVLPLALAGCKSRAEKPASEEMVSETVEMVTPAADEALSIQAVVEPAQAVATETIPPTAALPQATDKTAAVVTEMAQSRNRDIQTALKNAGFYAGAIDGKIGPKSKEAILNFQKANGLKVDGKIGPKTWAALEKYLIRQ
jgi:peptidoglycan hydrolase-like protein with peptidoglycan-binding domain